jgi:hypothetical protein
MRAMTPLRLALIAMTCIGASAACDQAVQSLRQRTISGNYQLERDEPNYFLIDNQHDATMGGVVGGVILSIGWSERQVVVYRHAIMSADPDGYVVVDLADGTISTTMDLTDIKADPELMEIKILPVSDAWLALADRQNRAASAKIETDKPAPAGEVYSVKKHQADLAAPARWCANPTRSDPLIDDAVTLASATPGDSNGLAPIKQYYRIPTLDRRDIVMQSDEEVCEQGARAHDFVFEGVPRAEHRAFVPVKVIRLGGVWMVESARDRSRSPWRVNFFSTDWQLLGPGYGSKP